MFRFVCARNCVGRVCAQNYFGLALARNYFRIVAKSVKTLTDMPQLNVAYPLCEKLFHWHSKILANMKIDYLCNNYVTMWFRYWLYNEFHYIVISILNGQRILLWYSNIECIMNFTILLFQYWMYNEFQYFIPILTFILCGCPCSILLFLTA